jgi:hypothetical protein
MKEIYGVNPGKSNEFELDYSVIEILRIGSEIGPIFHHWIRINNL